MTRGKKKREVKMKVVYFTASGKRRNLSASGKVIDLFKTQHSRVFC